LVCHCAIFGTTGLPFLIFGPNLRAWPDCRVSAEFLYVFICKLKQHSPLSMFSSPLALVIQRLGIPIPATFLESRNLSHNSLFCLVPLVSSEDLALPVSPAVNFTAFLTMQVKTEGELFLQLLWTPSAGSHSSPPGLSRIQPSPACHLWHYFHF